MYLNRKFMNRKSLHHIGDFFILIFLVDLFLFLDSGKNSTTCEDFILNLLHTQEETASV